MSRTVVEALEKAAALAEPWRGYTLLDDESANGAEPFFSYAGAERASARYGGALQALGLRKNDRVALILPRGDEFLFTFLGSMRAGMIPVPMYPPTGLGQLAGYLENARHIVLRSGARAVVTTAKIKRLLGTVLAACPSLKTIVAIEGLADAREELAPARVEPDDIAFVQFTSGSTSRPKGVTLTHANLTANIEALTREGLGLRGDDVGVSWLPLYHDMGLIGFALAPIYERVPVVLIPPLAFLKRPAIWLRTLSRHRGTISFGPNFAYALAQKRIRDADLQGVDLSAWRIAGCGAEPIRADTLEGFARTFSKVGFSASAFTASYGMAEATLAVSFQRGGLEVDVVHGPTLWEEGVAKPTTADDPDAMRLVVCGKPFEGHKIGVFSLDDERCENPLPERTVGEIRLSGPSVMRGYFDDRDRTSETLAGGWLRTGDLGYHADHRLVLCGRSKEIIIVNGRNFYPQDLEWEAGKVAGVRRGNVIAFGTYEGRQDRERVVVAFETSADGLDERRALGARVRQTIQEALGLTVDDVVALAPGVLPKTSSGKLQRVRTRALYEQGELESRAPNREEDRVEAAKELLKSQLSFFATRVLARR